MTTLLPGRVLGAYRVIEQVGKGGMATVYKAYQPAMDRYVAIKILPFQFAQTEEFVERFQREVRVIARLEHPHILPVYDCGESEGVPYLVMRFMDTGTLKERMQAGALSLDEIDHLFSQLAEALGYAHSKNIIHRDIKPSNVLIDERGEVFLTDFGVARLIEGATQLTATGAITGTPAYMSPEQAQGEDLDARSDIYSLGIVLYEMITGRVPFEAETPLAVILKHLQAELPLPTSLKPDLHPAIERVLLKALARKREERFGSTAEFVVAWKQAVQLTRRAEAVVPAAVAAPTPAPVAAPAPLPVPPAAAAPSPLRSKLRSPRWIAAGVVGLVVLLIIAGAAVSKLRAPFSARATPTRQILRAGTEPTQMAAEGVVTTLPPAAAVSQWESWAAANTLFAVVPHAGKIYTGGPGGITIWDPADGSYQRVTTHDGLPDPIVNALFFDANGVLWVGTESGLARFDGTNWTIYDSEDGLDSDSIRVITGYNGQLLAGTAYSGVEGGGLNLFDSRVWKSIPNFPSAGEDPNRFRYDITALLSDEKRGGLWVGTPNGLGWYDGANWTRYTTADGLPDNTINSLTLDRNGDLLIGAGRGAARFDGRQFTPFESLAESEVRAALQDDEGRYWFAGWGVTRFDPPTGNLEYYDPDSGEIPARNLIVAAKDENGILYFGSEEEGLVRFDGDFTLLEVLNVPHSAAFWRILLAPDGRLWFVEEYGQGVDIYDPQSGVWSRGADLPCSPLAFDAGQTLWCGGDTGLWLITADSQTNLTSRHGLPSDNVWSVALAPDGGAWVGSAAGLVLVKDMQVVEVLSAAEIGAGSDEIRFVFLASDGALWVVTATDLNRMTPSGKWEHYGQGRPFTENFYAASRVAEDASGAIWVATLGDGVYRFRDGDWQQFIPTDPGVNLPSDEINSVTLAADGSLWFGASDGAARFDGQAWVSFTVADGLIFPYVNDIYIDSSGAAWFATRGGVTRYQP